MDPDETLRQIRELVADQLEQPTYEKGRKLAALVDALDEWIIHGGFLPRDWTAFLPR